MTKQAGRRSQLRWFIPGALVALLALSGACGDGDRPPPGGGASPPISSSSASSSGNVVEGGAGDADADAGEVTGPALCEGLEQKSQEVAEYTMVSAPPAAVGGTIRVGLWVLNDMTLFTADDPTNPDPPPPGPTGKLARATLIVSPKSIRRLEARGSDAEPLPADKSTGVTYVINGNKLQTTPVCPSGGAASEVTYSASANLLTLHVDPKRIEIYRYVP